MLKLVEVLTDIAESAIAIEHDISEAGDESFVFSAYTDTIETMHAALEEIIANAPAESPLADYQGRLAPYIVGAQGGGTVKDRSDVLARFCPKTAGSLNSKGEPVHEDRYDILLTTDVLSEGVNLGKQET